MNGQAPDGLPPGHVVWPPTFSVPPPVLVPGAPPGLGPGAPLQPPVGAIPVAQPPPQMIKSMPMKPTEPLPEDQSYEDEARKLADRICGFRPTFLAFTWPMNSSQKCFYPVVKLGRLTEAVERFYPNREEAVKAAAEHCYAKLQATLKARTAAEQPRDSA